MSDRDGVIRSQKNCNPETPDIIEVQFDCKPGDSVHNFKIGPHRIGHVITKGETLEDAVSLLEEALNNIDIVVE